MSAATGLLLAATAISDAAAVLQRAGVADTTITVSALTWDGDCADVDLHVHDAEVAVLIARHLGLGEGIDRGHSEHGTHVHWSSGRLDNDGRPSVRVITIVDDPRPTLDVAAWLAARS